MLRFILIILFTLGTQSRQGETSSEPGSPEIDQTTSAQEDEAKGIIPPGGDIVVSTHPITPVTRFPARTRHEQALEELDRAIKLWNTGNAEAASDTALEAYDDLLEIHRVPRANRGAHRARIHQAAKIYVEAGITTIKNYVRQEGRSPSVLKEGRARLEDLRDVAKDFKELNKLLNAAIAHL